MVFLIILFIYFCLCWVFIAARGLSLVVSGATLRCGARASHCGGFFCCEAQALERVGFSRCGTQDSGCGSWALEHRLCSCDSRA